MFDQSKVNREKVECLVRKMSFDNDYRTKHTKKYHSEMIAAYCNIPYKIVGAPESLFV